MVFCCNKSTTKCILKIACILMFLFIIIMTLGSIVGYWRAVRTRPFNESTFYDDDVVMAHIGILNNVKADTTFISKYPFTITDFNFEYTKDCNCGFVGDKYVLTLLCSTLVINVLNILLVILSFCTRNERYLWMLFTSCSLGTVFLISAVCIFSVNYNYLWIYQEEIEAYNPTKFKDEFDYYRRAKGEWKYVYDYFPYEINYDYSVYLTIMNIMISALSIVFSTTIFTEKIRSSPSSISFPTSESY